MTSAAPNDTPAAAREATGANGPTERGSRANIHVAATARATPDHESEAELADDEQDELVEAVGVRALDPGDQADRERDRHRVVPARLGLERASETAADLREAEGREHGRGVGGRDDGAEQERLEPGEVEQRLSRDAGEQRGHDDSDGAQQRRRHRHFAQSPPRCLQAALEEDQDEPDDADVARELGVVELDAARPVRAEEHPQRQERDEDRHAGPRRAERDEHAGAEHGPDEEEHESFVHLDILAARGRSCSARAGSRWP